MIQAPPALGSCICFLVGPVCHCPPHLHLEVSCQKIPTIQKVAMKTKMKTKIPKIHIQDLRTRYSSPRLEVRIKSSQPLHRSQFPCWFNLRGYQCSQAVAETARQRLASWELLRKGRSLHSREGWRQRPRAFSQLQMAFCTLIGPPCLFISQTWLGQKDRRGTFHFLI